MYETAKSKGFWPEDRDKGEAAMLIVSELGEALEAHRKKHTAIFHVGDPVYVYLIGYDSKLFSQVFKTHVKDTLQDEIADTVIRLLDFCGGFKHELLYRDYRKESTGNFGHDLFRIIHYIDSAYHNGPKDWGYVLSALLHFCSWYKIDIFQHVQWKMRFNTTREHKHGKDY